MAKIRKQQRKIWNPWCKPAKLIPVRCNILPMLCKLVIGLVRLESLRPGFVDSRFESLIPGFVMGWLHIQTTQAEAIYLHWLCTYSHPMKALVRFCKVFD